MNNLTKPMRTDSRRVACGVALAALVALSVAGSPAGAQTVHRSGQSVQPVYEGWSENADGSFTMWFGYLNRNYEESPHISVGSGNFFEPGPPDRGQPTFFYPRRQNFVFGVTVPADWGDEDLIWTMSHEGQAYTAVGSLWATWAVDEGVWRANRGAGLGGRTGKEAYVNEPPSIVVVGDDSVRAVVGEEITLQGRGCDVGRPGAQPERARRPRRGYDPLPNDLPTIGGRRSGAASGVGGPTDQNMVKVRAAYETGLAVTWLQHRGPGEATFGSMVSPVELQDGEASTTVRFSEPGIYVIRAAADDGSFMTTASVTVTVGG